MIDSGTFRARVRDVYQRNERKLVVGYIALLGLGAVLLAAAPARRPLLRGTERIAASWDDRWSRKLAEAEALVAAGRLDSAAVYLERLDLEFPARHIKHARDAERQRLLRALGQTYLQLGSGDRALLTYRKLLAFDPRNFANHYDLALACIDAGEEAEARTHLLEALAINPGHLPSLRSYTRLAYDVGEYATVVSAYDKYLASFMLNEINATAGDTTLLLELPVDGQFHDVTALLSRAANWRGLLSLNTGGLEVEIERVLLSAPIVTGQLGRDSVVLQKAAGESWRVVSDSAFGLQLQAGARGLERVELRMRARKPVDQPLWTLVERSYRNLLDTEGLTRARAMSFVLATPEAADAVRRPE
jgi:tetratricopeptide (TPR) repeat protein